jgi:hypothetical protein
LCYNINIKLSFDWFTGLLSVDVSPNSANVVPGTNQQITCTVTGTPTATGITWTRLSNNQLTTLDIVNSNGKYTGGTTSDPHLHIDNFQSSDAGTYVCRATNVAGSQNSDNSVLTYIRKCLLCCTFCSYVVINIYVQTHVQYMIAFKSLSEVKHL